MPTAQLALAQPKIDSQGLIDDGCEDIAKSIAFAALESAFGNWNAGLKITSDLKPIEAIGTVDDLIIDPAVAGATTGEWFKKLMEGVFKVGNGQFIRGTGIRIGFPGIGLVIDGGRVVIGSTTKAVEDVISAARAMQFDAMIFGGRSFGNDLNAQVDFFGNIPALQEGPLKGSRISPDNFGEGVVSEEQLKQLWYYAYRLRLAEFNLRKKDDPAIDEILLDGWPRVLEYWQSKRLSFVLDKIRADLSKAALAHAQGCKTESAGTSSATDDDAGIAPGQAFLELVETRPDKIPNPGWTINADAMTIQYQHPNGEHAEFYWKPVPKKIGLKGFDFTMGVQATSALKNRMAAGIGAKSGLVIAPPAPSDVDVYSENGQTVAKSTTIHLQVPVSLADAGYADGSDVWLMVGAHYYGGVSYRYQVRNPAKK